MAINPAIESAESEIYSLLWNKVLRLTVECLGRMNLDPGIHVDDMMVKQIITL